MNTESATSIGISDLLDIVDTALATISRRLPVHVGREDLATVGKLALISALGQCSGSVSEVRAYCFVRVRGAILDELRRLDPLSRRRREQLTAVVRAQAELSARLGRAATRAEIAVATKLSLSEVTAVQQMLAQESEFSETEVELLPDTEASSPAETIEAEDLRLNLRGALQRLNSAQAAVLYRYYFDEVTLDVIAAEMGLSKERVRQIRDAGEKKLRADFIVLSIWQSLINHSRD
ncbi:MAG: sigma-70 family RNA polymerase sigma factor [Nibricoccus sp.]